MLLLDQIMIFLKTWSTKSFITFNTFYFTGFFRTFLAYLIEMTGVGDLLYSFEGE